MPISRALIAALGLTALVAADQAAAKELYSFKVGQWAGRAWQSDQTGKFSHCVVRVTHPNGVKFSLSFFVSGRFSLALYKKEWRLGKGKRYPIRLLVDGQDLGSYRARSLTDQLLSLFVPGNHRLIRRIRFGSMLTVRAAQRDFRFALTDSAKAIDRIKSCVNLAREDTPAAGENPFARDLGAGATPSPGSRNKDLAARPARNTRIQGFIRKLLGNAGLSGIRFEPPGKRKSKSIVASWRAPGVYGLYMVVKHGGRSIDEITGPFLARLGKSCKGRYGYGADVARRAGKYLLKKSTAACSAEGKGRFYVFATSVRSAQSIVIITHVARNRGEEDMRQVNSELENVLAGMLRKL